MNEEMRTERIENYIMGRLSDADRKAFEEDLQNDPALLAEVQKHQAAHKVIKYASQKQLKQRLQEIDADTNSPKTATRRKLYTRIAVAAAIIAAVALGITQLTLVQDQHRDRLASLEEIREIAPDYFSPTNMDVQRGGAPTTEGFQAQLAEADKKYQDGDYQAAIQQYEKLSQEAHALNDRAEWNLLISRLSAGQLDKDLLRQILDDPRHMYNEKATKLADAIGLR